MSDLTKFRDHCRSKARQESDPLWAVLADEVDAYLDSEAWSEVDVPLDFA